MEEDLLAVVAAHEAEAALGHQLLDAAAHLRARRRGARRGGGAPAAARAGDAARA